MLAYAEKYDNPRNSENPELYAIYPFRLFGLGKPDLDLAKATFAVRRFKNNGCWSQDGVQAAYLGDVEAARRNVAAVFKRKDPQCRFPAFWEHANDYVPDEDNGGNGLHALQLDAPAIRRLEDHPPARLAQAVGRRVQAPRPRPHHDRGRGPARQTRGLEGHSRIAKSDVIVPK